ncbi:hypothetical protein BWQ96_01331 [Gracilariopsis chorda]|uniref:Uncharacterized protein n=1 Tax=Gracilariopsis chorda TaxID=448386 RepID=A0A2V3J311_9FLOR|nr:hypothetical protein BWQ96_01331 [Gracilariopsis chorda]|eukprot:PXF48775.1 hypothetical protein BWQ96_01331 [Gracilariopsis chorda]
MVEPIVKRGSESTKNPTQAPAGTHMVPVVAEIKTNRTIDQLKSQRHLEAA